MINVNDPVTFECRYGLNSSSLLGLAVRNDLEEIVKLLLNHGATQNRESTSHKESPGNDRLYEIFERNWKDPRCLNNEKHSLLEIAVARRNITIVDALCSFGADIMARTTLGATLIHRLAMNHPDYVHSYFNSAEKCNSTLEYLIGKGLYVAAIDIYHWTALHFAVAFQGHQPELLPIFINAGTPINAQNNKGDTALSLAAEFPYIFSRTESVKVLLSQGADPSIANNNGLTALDQAWKAYRSPRMDEFQLKNSKYNIKLLTIASQDNFVQDIWRLFVDDS